MINKKLTLSIRRDLIDEVKKIAIEHEESLSNVVENILNTFIY